MKPRARASTWLLLLLLPTLATGIAAKGPPTGVEDPVVQARLHDQPADLEDPSAAIGAQSRHGLPTKDAPVDGKDGKPHSGPFVGSERSSTDLENKELPPLKGRPEDPTVIDGKKIPESNDGVMFDKNRERPQEGSRGTEGGVSEKAKARKAQEGKTGGKLTTQAEASKEQPPLPHSKQQKLRPTEDKEKDKEKEKGKTRQIPDSDPRSTEYTGLDKPEGLTRPSRERGKAANRVNRNQYDPPRTNQYSSANTKAAEKAEKASYNDDDEGIIQPIHSLILSLAMILVSEIGDKTFLIAALMAMKHDRMVVFGAAFGALLFMTVLSAILGHAVPTILSKRLTNALAAALFLIFGAKLLREGWKMDPHEGITAEMHEVEQELAEKEKELSRKSPDSVTPHALEMRLLDREPRSMGRLVAPPRSPSQSPSRDLIRHSGSLATFLHGVSNLCSFLLSPVWIQTFAMIFLGEWGDRSQIATIAMAAGRDYRWVTLGAICGHAICTGVAVLGGRAIAGRVSMKVVTMSAAAVFLLFGFIYTAEVALNG